MNEESEVKLTRDDYTALTVVVSFVCVLLIFCYKAGYGSGHSDALESGYWYCVPSKTELEVYPAKKIYPTK